MEELSFFFHFIQSSMYSWLLSLFNIAPVEMIDIQLVPDINAQQLPGFRGGPLTLSVAKGSTLQELLDNFNKYRGPDSQIHKLFSRNGDTMILSEKITVPKLCVVKKI